jgi:hypothetical protein
MLRLATNGVRGSHSRQVGWLRLLAGNRLRDGDGRTAALVLPGREGEPIIDSYRGRISWSGRVRQSRPICVGLLSNLSAS